MKVLLSNKRMSPTNRDYTIDVLKCFAALLITYSHMELQFGKFSALATGGSFGDCLFFFCSGYTLLLSSKQVNFFNWYKNRINRIYPAVFAWAFISYYIFDADWNMGHVLRGIGFFVTCIMLFYIPFYPLRKLKQSHLLAIAALVYMAVWGAYFVIDRTNIDTMYNWTWSMYFLPMLMGAIMGKTKKEGTVYRLKNLNTFWSIVLLVVSAAMYYVLMYFTNAGSALEDLRPLIILPQLGVVFGLYRLCSSKLAERLYNKSLSHTFMMFVGGICLEIYLVQPKLLAAFPMTEIFPLNILVMYVLIIACAYGLKVLSRIWAQTFKDDNYNWKEIIKLY